MKTLIRRLHPENFHREVIEEDKPMLVLCMPADDRFPEQLKIMEEFAETFHSSVKVGWVEEEFLDVFKTNYSIIGTPTFLLFFKGREKGRVLGLADQETLRALVEGMIGLPPYGLTASRVSGDDQGSNRRKEN